MNRKLLIALAAAGVVGTSVAAYGPSAKGAKSSGCGMSNMTSGLAATAMGNAITSDVKSPLCWNNRIKLGFLGEFGLLHEDGPNSAGTATVKSNAFGANYFVGTVDAKFTPSMGMHMSRAFASDGASLDTGLTTEMFVTYTQDDMYARIGKQYLSFGEGRNPLALVQSLGDSVTYANDSALSLGMDAGQGFSGEVFVAQSHDDLDSLNNVGLSMKFDTKYSGSDLGFHVSYMNDARNLGLVDTVGGAINKEGVYHVALSAASQGLSGSFYYDKVKGDLTGTADTAPVVYGLDLGYAAGDMGFKAGYGKVSKGVAFIGDGFEHSMYAEFDYNLSSYATAKLAYQKDTATHNDTTFVAGVEFKV